MVVVVGLNLGFRLVYDILLLYSIEVHLPVINLCLVHRCCNCRRENLGIWKKWYLRKVRVEGLTAVMPDKSSMSLERQDEDENRYADVK